MRRRTCGFVVAAASCALSALSTACSTVAPTDGAEPTDRRLLVENKITAALAADPLIAGQIIGYQQQREELFLRDELDHFHSVLQTKLRNRLDEQIDSQRFPEALALAASIAAMGYDPPPLSPDQIRYLAARQQLQSDDYLPLLFTMHAITDYRRFTLDELSVVLDIAVRHNHRTLIASILDSVSDLYPVLARRYRPAVAAPATLNDMLAGTVTIWVDKGFTITDGVGHPDRVFGSAFFVDARGYLITNYHVIASEVDPEYEGFSRLYIRLADDSNLRVPAKVIGYDRLLDIALLKTEVEPDYIFGIEPNQGNYVSGTRTYALGSPVGLSHSITSGIISSPSRQFLPIGQALQIDAPVNPGNSGGPLVDSAGTVIGVVYAGLPQFQGINFAIPISWVWQSMPNLFAGEHSNHLWLGVAVKKIAGRLEVIYVMPDSPADRANIEIGDILTHIDDRPVTEIGDAQAHIAAFHTNRLIRVGWLINDSAYTYPMRIESRPFSPVEQALMFQRPEELFAPLFGMRANRIGGNLNSNRYVIIDVYSATAADELGFAATDPFTVLHWQVDTERRTALMQINIKKTRGGFTASGLQMISSLDLPNFV